MAGANAGPPDVVASALRPSDSLAAAVAELSVLQTAAKLLAAEHVHLVAARDLDRAALQTMQRTLESARAADKRLRERIARTYVESRSGRDLNSQLRPDLGVERSNALARAADRSVRKRIETLDRQVLEAAARVNTDQARLAKNERAAARIAAQIFGVATKLSASRVAIGRAGDVAPATTGNTIVARLARAADDALVVRDLLAAGALAAARTAAQVPTVAPPAPVLHAATAHATTGFRSNAHEAGTHPNAHVTQVATLVTAAAAADDAARQAAAANAEYVAKRRDLAAALGAQVHGPGARFDVAWALTPTHALRAMYFALSQVGKPYVYAMDGPDTYDCSGLTRRAWEETGIALPHFSGAQLHSGLPVPPTRVRPGDLLAYGPDGGTHVTMSIGAGFDVEAKGRAYGVVVQPADVNPLGGWFAGASRPLP